FAVFRREKPAARDPNPALNSHREPEAITGRFATHSSEMGDVNVRLASIDASLAEIYKMAREEQLQRAREKFRSEAVHAMSESVEMMAIQMEKATRERAEILRELRGREK